MNFNEKDTEYCAKTKSYLPVSILSNYKVAKAKAEELINAKKYGLTEADFWILMNTNKAKDKMLYSGLIISHNGCLKINDALEENKRFKPSCVSLDKEGYNDSLVYSYCCDEQGIFDVGEISSKNCSNDYPYAMAFKRLFDRVVLKNSKIGYNGIYSETESDEFKNQYDDEQTPKTENLDKPKGKFTNKTEAAAKKIDEHTIMVIQELSKETGTNIKSILNFYNVENIEDLTVENADRAIKSLQNKRNKK